MKFLFGLFLAVGALDDLNCPARCWENINGACLPAPGTITLDCSTHGEVTVNVDSCLFTPENADYTQLYQFFFNSTESLNNPNCFRTISAANDTFSFTLMYSEAEACGWEWSTTETQLVFSSFLRPTENINKVTHQGHIITISQFPDDIDLTCNYVNKVTVSADFSGYMANNTQDASAVNNVSLADGFGVMLMSANNTVGGQFTVGESITAEFIYDYAGAGHTLNTTPFGFFATHCFVENNMNQNQTLDIIGGGVIPDQCKMDNSILNLHVSRVFAGQTDWSVSQYDLTFDAFKFQTSNSLTLICEFQLCLTADCGLQTTTVCPFVY